MLIRSVIVIVIVIVIGPAARRHAELVGWSGTAPTAGSERLDDP